MSFYTEIDNDQVVERHAKELAKLQKEEAKRIIKNYTEVRKELIARLSHAKYDSFTAHRLRTVLAQVDHAIASMSQQLGMEISLSSYNASKAGVEHLVKELNRFEKKFKGAVRPLNLDVIRVAGDTSNFLLTQYKESMKGYDQELKIKVVRALTHAAISEVPYSQVIKNISDFFTGQEWQIHRIARTEMMNVYALGKLNAMKDARDNGGLTDLKKALYHPMDSRTGQDSIELAQQNPIVELDEPFEQTYRRKDKHGKPTGKTYKYIFQAPPNRPNDRSILIPYRDSWHA